MRHLWVIWACAVALAGLGVASSASAGPAAPVRAAAALGAAAPSGLHLGASAGAPTTHEKTKPKKKPKAKPKKKPKARPKPPSTAPAQPTPPVQGLDACSAGPDCFYGPIYNSYPDYGNVAPQDLGDCTFAAVSDWEQITLGIHPDATTVGYEFAEAGGTADGGLSVGGLAGYWLTSGINGAPLVGMHALPTDQASVEKYVRQDTALLVSFEFQDGGVFGPYQMTEGGHMAVVDGFTPAGPLVVSWGETLQVTWQEWNSDVQQVWDATTKASSDIAPGVSLFAPQGGPSVGITGCWVQYTGNDWANVSPEQAATSFTGSDLLARGPANFWTVLTLQSPPAATLPGVTVTLLEPDGDEFQTVTLDDWTSAYAEQAVVMDWTWNPSGFFFEHPEISGSGRWFLAWVFPDGESCVAPFTVS